MRRVRMFFGVLLASLLLAACSDVRPVAKIGLIAPFEGLHRRTGYEALAAMRQAIADAPAATVGFIPLALDDSADPDRARRAAEKLLADPQVKAVIGPHLPWLAEAGGDVLDGGETLWLAPFAVAPPGGFADPLDSSVWASGLIEAAGAAVQRQGAHTLYLAGDRRGWPAWDEAEWSSVAGLPVRFLKDSPAAIAESADRNAIFWLGSAEDAADFLNRLPPEQVDLLFWLGPAGADPVLSERLKTDRKLYWLAWSNLLYTEWAARHSPSTPSAFLVYQATRAAIDAVTGAGSTEAAPWHVELFEVKDGVSRSFIP